MENRFQTADRLNLFEIMLVGLSFYSAPVIARHDWKKLTFPSQSQAEHHLKTRGLFCILGTMIAQDSIENSSSYLNLDLSV